MIPIVSLIGIPASGKGSIGSKLANQFSLYHLVISDLLNELSNSRTDGEKTVKRYIYDYVMAGGSIPADLCTELNRYMDKTVETVMDDFYLSGNPIPLGILLPALQKKIEQVSEDGGYRAVILNSFPRQLDDLKAAEHVFARTIPDLTIWIDCPEESARSRYSKRALEGFEKQVAHFNEHMPLLLPELEHIGLVWSKSDDSMSIDDAYIRLLTLLFHNEAWNVVVNN
ncbi:hypothetical protein F4805DRAFT_476310 [Annulohypoxylon moriforme]|nr:hypothetical protein F4805DRAFT_476310 [Annulohypoxylon moriforme]